MHDRKKILKIMIGVLYSLEDIEYKEDDILEVLLFLIVQYMEKCQLTPQDIIQRFGETLYSISVHHKNFEA